MEHPEGNALVRLTATFEGRELTVIALDDKPHWLAKEIGEALGYADDGRSFVGRIGGEWSDDLIEGVDYTKLIGEDLAAAKRALGPDVIDPRTPSLLLLTEAGVYSASLLSRQPAAKRLRRWLADEVLPQIARTGAYTAPTPKPYIEVHREEQRRTILRYVLTQWNEGHIDGLLLAREVRRLTQDGVPEEFAGEIVECLTRALMAGAPTPLPLKAGTWVRFEEWWWNELYDVRSKLPARWPEPLALLFLRWASRRSLWGHAGFPGRMVVAKLLGWTEGEVRTLLRHPERWVEPEDLERWNEHYATHYTRKGEPRAAGKRGGGE